MGSSAFGRPLPPMTSAPLAGPPTALIPAVVLHRVSKLYGDFVALRDVSLTLAAGSSVVLLGANGAGKSTLLKLLAGLTQPSYGEVRLWAKRAETVRGRVAYMSHQTMLYDELTGVENLTYFLGLQRPELARGWRSEHVATALNSVGLDPANPRRLAEYSQGMRQRAALARTLLTDPDLVLLDEPFSNLDTASAEAMIAQLQRYLRQPGTGNLPRTLLLTTHQAELARPLAQQTWTLSDGRLTNSHQPTLTGPPAVLPAEVGAYPA